MREKFYIFAFISMIYGFHLIVQDSQKKINTKPGFILAFQKHQKIQRRLFASKI